MYIGETKVEKKIIEDGPFESFLLSDGRTIRLHEDLVDGVVTKEKRDNHSITDIVTHVIATKFLLDLANYGLEYYFVDHVGTKMRILTHNLREELLRRTFECTGGDAIPLTQIVGPESADIERSLLPEATPKKRGFFARLLGR